MYLNVFVPTVAL